MVRLPLRGLLVGTLVGVLRLIQAIQRPGQPQVLATRLVRLLHIVLGGTIPQVGLHRQ